MKSAVAFVVTIVAGLIFVTVATVGWSVGRGTVSAAAATASHPALVKAHLYLTIATPAMLGTEVGPAYLPSSMTVPAYAEVTVTVANFDGNTPLVGAATKYAKATGISGKLSSRVLDPVDPNAASKAAAHYSMSVDPSGVSHTFTVDSLGLNVPICGNCQTTFTFFTTAPGHYTWRCMDPCGPGTSGWEGAMAMDGYMSGQLNVV